MTRVVLIVILVVAVYFLSPVVKKYVDDRYRDYQVKSELRVLDRYRSAGVIEFTSPTPAK